MKSLTDYESPKDFIDKATDIIMRNILSGVPGLVESDRLLDALTALYPVRAEQRPPDEETALIGDFLDIQMLTIEDAQRLGPELGSKAKNLVIAKEMGLPVPAGAVLPARCDGGRGLDGNPERFLSVVKDAVRAIEARTGKEFGGTENPLFLSVRSGSYPSMPGILNSILYCGMNDDTRAAFMRTTGDPTLAWDSSRRFIEHYGTSVLGVPSDFFDRIAAEIAAEEAGAAPAIRLEKLAVRYREKLRAAGHTIPSDVHEQLHRCIRAIYASWHSDRARQFRAATGTSDTWGTSVTLMEMVSGNRKGSGASVFFTRDPASKEPSLYGETREDASGDDLASGRKAGRPLSRRQGRSDAPSLEESDPELYRIHRDLAVKIEDSFGGLPQEVEVTYTRDGSGVPSLFVLQVRRMVEEEERTVTFDEICRMESRVIGRGIGANGGALSGIASFAETAGAIEDISKRTGMPVILLRRTANTGDVPLMPFIRGIITRSGGVTSHAAVLAHTFGIAAVLACADLTIEARDGVLSALIGDVRIEEGTPLSIDGSSGLVFSGVCFPDRGKEQPDPR